MQDISKEYTDALVSMQERLIESTCQIYTAKIIASINMLDIPSDIVEKIHKNIDISMKDTQESMVNMIKK